MDSDFRAFLETPGVKPIRRRRSYNAFGWAVCLLLLTGVVMASWIGSFYVFSHPENPDCYHFLKTLNKVEPPKRFEITAAPPGKFFTAKELYNSYLTMSQEEIDQKNTELLRDYIRNYANMKTPVPYVCGNFTTTAVYELGGADMFSSGVAAVADSVDCPPVMIEHIYPTAFANIPRVRQMLATDPEIRLEKTFSLSAIVHVEKLAEGKILFTVMPLDYGKYAFKEGISSTFRLDPPSGMNLEAGMPVIKPDAMENAEKTFASYRKNKGLLAKGKMFTLPPPVPAQETALYAATDVPAEAYLPLKQPEIAAPAIEPAPENVTASATSAPVPPADELPQTVRPSVKMEPAPQTVPESPVVPTTQQPVSVPAVTSNPVIAKIVSPEPPAVPASTPPPAPASPPAVATAKPQKIAPKTTAPVLPAPAPVIANTTHPAVSKPKVPIVAVVPHIPAKPIAVSTPAPPPVIERAQPLPSAAPQAVYASTATLPASSVPGVKLEPFITAPQPPPQQTTPVAATTTWRTYQPGTMPRGKLLTWQDAPELAALGIGNERVYMQGRFIVTASTEGRAVLRPVTYSGGSSVISVRIVVEYPGGTRAPAEGTPIARGGLRPFQIVDVRRGNDGQVNVYAREITEPLNTASYDTLRNYRDRMVQRENAYY